MLVLTRRVGEKLIINDDIVIELLSINTRNSIKVGITAPKDISIIRDNIKNKTRRETPDNI